MSQYLRQELHGIFESVDKSSIPELFQWIQELGGYFKRFKGGALAPWIYKAESTPRLDLAARATQAFFEVGRPYCSRRSINSLIPTIDRQKSIFRRDLPNLWSYCIGRHPSLSGCPCCSILFFSKAGPYRRPLWVRHSLCPPISIC